MEYSPLLEHRITTISWIKESENYRFHVTSWHASGVPKLHLWAIKVISGFIRQRYTIFFSPNLLLLAEVLHRGRRKSLVVHQTEGLRKLCRHTVVPTAWMWWECSAFTFVLAAFHHSAKYKFPALQYQFILNMICSLIYNYVTNQQKHTDNICLTIY